MENKKKALTFVTGILIILMGIYILFQGSSRLIDAWKKESQVYLLRTAQKVWIPALVYSDSARVWNVQEWIYNQAKLLIPLTGYINEANVNAFETEDTMTYEMILTLQAEDETHDTVSDSHQDTASRPTSKPELSMEKLRDFDYLIRNFYTVDSTTMISKEQLNVDELLAKDMHINTEEEGPKVLIFHTHSQESFADSKQGDAKTSIVGMGAYLAELLNQKGIPALHHDGVYDLIDGRLDRSKAYELSETGVRKLLKEYPSIEVVIDLHRDGVGNDTHLVTEIDGQQTAKIMFFNGLSRTKANGDIAYLKNPYIQDNLSFSLQMQLAAEEMYPGFARRIYLKGYRYSLHMMPKSLLIEAGAQTNTVEEIKNAMTYLADVLYQVLVE